VPATSDSTGAEEPKLERSALDVTNELLKAHRGQEWDVLRTLFHPEAKVGVFATGGAPVDPERAIAAMRRAHLDRVYSASADRITVIDDDVVLLEGRVRHRTEDGGIAFIERAWLYVFVAGLLFRSAMFKSPREARIAYEVRGRTLGF
jgi:hypothetical protein